MSTLDRPPNPLASAWDRLMLGMAFLMSVLVLAMTLAVCFEVVMRYFLNSPTIWVVDFVEYGLVYVTFFGAAWVLRENAHIRVDILFERLRPRQRLLVEVFIMLAIAVTMAVFVWKGTELVWESFVKNQAVVKAWQVPRWIVLLPIPVAGLLMMIESLRQAGESLTGWLRGSEAVAHRPIESGEGAIEESRGI